MPIVRGRGEQNAMSKLIENEQYDVERALYNACDVIVSRCKFAGPLDGESALKESQDIKVEECEFRLRYPLWHVTNFEVDDCKMTNTCRAPLWYCRNGKITNTVISGVKAVRECKEIEISDCNISSAEFGWKSSDISISHCDLVSEYLLLDSKNINLSNVKMRGKYSFQYTRNLIIENSELDTKDAFWHSKNATVSNSVIKGEYLGWYSENLTLINCHIAGTQPLCYCKNLNLINCTMEDCDLAFEYSEVHATIVSHVESIKNPLSGIITADSVGETIRDNPAIECDGEIVIREKYKKNNQGKENENKSNN